MGVIANVKVLKGATSMLTSSVIFAITLLTSTSVGAAPAKIQSLEDIRMSVARFLEDQPADAENPPHIRVGHLDSRLRMSQCDTPLKPFFPLGGHKTGNITVGVRCDSPKPWTLYVAASIKLYKKVVVLARTLPRGTRLTKDDLRLEERDTGILLSGYLSNPDEAMGMNLSRPLPAGYPLNSTTLEMPKIVRRGQRVTLLAQTSGIEVRSEGNALMDGATGDLISVRNLRSKRVVEGVVVGDGIIEVRM